MLEVSPLRPVTTPIFPLPGIAVPGQFQLRSRDPGLPSVGLSLRLWWLTGSGESSSLYSLELSLCNSIVFTSPLVNRLCVLEAGITRVTTPSTKVAGWPDTRHRWELNPGSVWWKVSALPLSHPDNPFPCIMTLWWRISIVQGWGMWWHNN